jgi:hypothetical protein
MRLKEDKSSWAANGIIKRDFRNDPSQLNTGMRRKSKKDTKRWCKGHVGVEHVWENITPPNDRLAWRKMDICKNCGRQSYTNVKYYCRTHDTWDKHIHWNENHTHQS